MALFVLSGSAWAQSDEGDPQPGERVFEAHCAMCHGSDAAGMMGMHPSLRGAVERLSPEGVEVTIRKGRNTTPPMPAFEDRLSEQAIDDLVSYIASLPQGPRNFGPGEGMEGMGDMMRDRDTSDGLVVGFVTALVVVLAVGALAGLVLRLRRRPAIGAHALALLDRRYALGELSHDEYLERRRDLEA